MRTISFSFSFNYGISSNLECKSSDYHRYTFLQLAYAMLDAAIKISVCYVRCYVRCHNPISNHWTKSRVIWVSGNSRLNYQRQLIISPLYFSSVNKICVSGSIFFDPERDDRKQVVKFGYTFKRRPSLTMAISRISGNIKFDGQDSFLAASFDEIYKSYAHAYITDQVQGLEALGAEWMACL